MARKPQPATPAPESNDSPAPPAELDMTETGMATVFGSEIEYNGVKLAVPAFEVPTAFAPAIKYLVQYGFNQSLQDCVSGMAKELRDEAFDIANGANVDHAAWPDMESDDFGSPKDYAPNAKGEPTTTPANVKTAIAASIVREMEKRRAAILTGNVTARGPRLPTVDRLVRDMALAYLKAFAKKKGQKLPKRPKDAAKGTPNVALNAMIDAAIASPLGAKWRAEAEKQIAALSAIDTATADFDPFAKPATPAAAA